MRRLQVLREDHRGPHKRGMPYVDAIEDADGAHPTPDELGPSPRG
jgi:hypothetical protein